MAEEKRFGQIRQVDQGAQDDTVKSSTSSRARNRTVMLTPEMTGQVRALLYKDPEEPQAPQAPERPTSGFGGRDSSVQDRGSGTGRINVERSGFEGGFGGQDETQRKTPSHSAFALGTGMSSVKAASVSLRRAATEAGGSMKAVTPMPTSRVVGFMVSFDKNEFGEVFELRVGRWLISSKMAEQQPCIVIDDESVSPLHAVVRATKDGKIQVLDQLSEYGTGVTSSGEAEERDATGTMVNVQHGDIVRFGERRFLICMIPAGEDVERRFNQSKKDKEE